MSVLSKVNDVFFLRGCGLIFYLCGCVGDKIVPVLA